MRISAIADERIRHVSIDAEFLIVDLVDGRRICTPLAWYPRLVSATRQQLEDWEIIGAGHGVHWEQLDEDLSAAGMLRGSPAAGYKPAGAPLS
jgi:hypothetical protein